MLNRIEIMGRLTADPDLKTTPSGVPVCTIRIACDRDFKNKETGERETDYVSLVTWRQTAEFVARNFSKGRMIVAEGRLQIRPYTDKEGNKRTAAEVVAENVYFVDSRQKEGTQIPTEYNSSEAGLDSFSELADESGDLPF